MRARASPTIFGSVATSKLNMPDMEPVHPGLAVQTPFTRARFRKSGEERAAAGAAYVTEWLRRQYGETSEPERQGDLRTWTVSPLTTQPFTITIAELALTQSYFQLGAWLGLIAEDARENPPTPPACYHVGPHGVLGVRHMNTVEFEAFGQIIRCERHGAGRNAKWTIAVDDAPRDQTFPADPEDLRDDVAQAALLLLCEARQIRIPEPPWQWSVIGALGREWWIRLGPGDPATGSARTLHLRDTVTGQEERMPWPDDAAPPRAGQLRRLVGG